ncbi:hypothetical protein, partial [Enterocloster clostridioformis]
LEFWEGTLKTLTPSLQENAKYFTTRSYLTLTVFLLFPNYIIRITALKSYKKSRHDFPTPQKRKKRWNHAGFQRLA